jgi:hypothetical protein
MISDSGRERQTVFCQYRASSPEHLKKLIALPASATSCIRDILHPAFFSRDFARMLLPISLHKKHSRDAQGFIRHWVHAFGKHTRPKTRSPLGTSQLADDWFSRMDVYRI